MSFVLRAMPCLGDHYSDGYYTGKNYIHQGSKYAVVESNISKAKIYTSKARAESACNKLSFENYSFEVKEAPNAK